MKLCAELPRGAAGVERAADDVVVRAAVGGVAGAAGGERERESEDGFEVHVAAIQQATNHSAVVRTGSTRSSRFSLVYEPWRARSQWSRSPTWSGQRQGSSSPAAATS